MGAPVERTWDVALPWTVDSEGDFRACCTAVHGDLLLHDCAYVRVSGFVDLRADTVERGSPTMAPGACLGLALSASNLGVAVPDTVDVSCTLRPIPLWPADVLVFGHWSTAVAGGNSHGELCLPNTMATGAWFLGCKLDSTGVLAETDESNNVAWTALEVYPSPFPALTGLTGALELSSFGSPPSLVIEATLTNEDSAPTPPLVPSVLVCPDEGSDDCEDVSGGPWFAPSVVAIGDKVHITVQLANYGASPIDGGMVLGTSLLDSAGSWASAFGEVPALGPADMGFVETLTVAPPGIPPGPYHCGATLRRESPTRSERVAVRQGAWPRGGRVGMGAKGVDGAYTGPGEATAGSRAELRRRHAAP